MKKIGIILLILSLTLAIVVGANELYDKEDITGFNFANVYVNGSLGLAKNKGFTRDVDNKQMPSTINWSGTTYVPLALLSKLMNAEVSWDGSIHLNTNSTENSANNSGFTYKTLSKITIPYKMDMSFDIKDAKVAFMENNKGEVINGLKFDYSNGIKITNPHLLSLNSDFILTVIKENEIITQPIKITGITLESFTDKHGVWYIAIPASPQKGFNYPIELGFVRNNPDNISKDFNSLKNTLIVEGSNTHVLATNEEDYNKQINERMNGELSVIIANKQNMPFMQSIFPRPTQNGWIYTHALDRDTLFGSQSYFDVLDRGNMYRLDKQFLSMINYSQDVLKSLGLQVEDKVGIAGFSASSDWATRFTMLYPEKIKWVISNLPATMPMETYKGEILKYPLGMGDITKVLGSKFDFETYKKIPHFMFVGGNDFGDGSKYGDGWGDYEESTYFRNVLNTEGEDYRRLFGEDPIQRRVVQTNIFDDLGITYQYISYKGLEHGWGDTQIDDIIKFINNLK